MDVSESLAHEWTLPDGRTALLRLARPEDRDPVRALYFRTYGEHYGLPEVVDPERTSRAFVDPSYLWLLAELEGRIVGSLVFVVDPFHRLGKSFGGVMDPELRGQKIMFHMLEEGLRHILQEGQRCEMVYGVVRTFISLTFHNDLKKLGYIDTGIFPNVRKAREYETHGMKIRPGPGLFERRRPRPRLIPEAQTLYEIVRSRLGALDPAAVERVALPPAGAGRVELRSIPDPEVEGGMEAERERLRQQGRLEFGFFPLHEPNCLLSDTSGEVRAFLHFHPKTGHASLLGMTTGGHDRVEVLLSLGEACETLGVKYLELLVSAYDPAAQAEAYQAYFLPCAYFPAARLAEDGSREDFLVTSRTFVPLHFKNLKLTEEAKPYLLEFFKVYTGRLWEELIDA